MTVRRRALVAAAAAMLAARMPAGGDQLADALRAGNAATEAAATLRSEIDALSKGAGDPRTDARIALRRVAFDLLFRGDAAEHGDASVVAGFRLAWLRAELDALVQSVPADAARAAALAGAVAEFANAAAHGVDRVPPPDRPEESLRALLEPLDRAVAATEADGRDPGTAWPAAIGRGNRPPAASAAWIEPAPAASMPADDAARIAAIQGWSATIRSCSPRSAAQFEASAKAWSTALRDRVRQAAARAAMDSFAAELPLAQPPGLERAIRSGDAAARAACAGRADDLLAELERRRAAWAAGWSNGRGSPAAGAALRQAVGVTRALGQASHVDMPTSGGTAGQGGSLAGGGGAAVVPGGWRTHPKALAARAALALESMLEGKADAVDRELAVLDRDLPIARLEHAAAEALGRWLPGHASLRARLRAVADGPGPDAWLGHARADLMRASRLLVEEVRARAMREDALATELRSRAAAAAARALGAARLPG